MYALSLSLSLCLHLTNTHADGVGCSYYMHPLNVTTGVSSPLSCEPVPVNPADFVKGNVTIVWRRFSMLEKLQYFVQNCSDSPEECSNFYSSEDYLIKKNSSGFDPVDYNLTIDNTANIRAWYVPSFTVNDNLTYVAPYTFLYRK